MQLEALDGFKLILLMLAGAIFSAAGLYLLLRPKDQGSAKIEIFGLKFESSSAGLLVFLIGAVFLAIPVFVPEKPAHPIAPTEIGGGTATSAEPSQGGGSAHPPLEKSDITKVLEEAEPNDTISEAQVLLPGQRVSGRTSHEQVDWYVVPCAQSLEGSEIRVRRTSGSDIVLAAMLDSREQFVKTIKVSGSTGFLVIDEPPGDVLYIRVTEDIGLPAGYEIIMSGVTSN